MNKKTIWIKIAIILMQVAPIVVYLAFEWNDIMNRPSQAIGLGLVVALITLALIFKDAIARFYKTPGTLKFVLTVFVVSGLGQWVGDTLFIASLIELTAVIISLPLQIIYNYIVRPAEAREILPLLDKLINKGENNDNKNN